jgi:hypothetical protein
VAELGLADKVVRLHEVLDGAEIPHAFGGALALAYYAEPRVTVDIDVNLFVDPDAYPTIVDLLAPLGVARGPDQSQVSREGQARLRWGRSPLDLFFAYDAVHEAMRRGARTVPFGPDRIPILGPDHLLIAKVVFNRPKDWLDIEQMLLAVPTLDLGAVYRWLRHLLGPEDGRTHRFQHLEARVLGPGKGD